MGLCLPDFRRHLWHSCPVTDLIFSGKSEDGSYIELSDGSGARYRVEIDESIRAALMAPRLVAIVNQSAGHDEAEVNVKQIQARLRAGETIDALARATGWSAEKIDKYSGPILQERAYVIGLALETPLRRDSHAPTLQIATWDQLSPRGVDMAEVEWNSHRQSNGNWVIVLTYPTKDGIAQAEWIFDIHNHSVVAHDETAKWIAGEDREPRSKVPSHGMIYPSEPQSGAPRLVAVREEEVTRTISISSAAVSGLLDLDEADPTLDPEARKDGVTKRIRIPSWDDILFGGKSDPE